QTESDTAYIGIISFIPHQNMVAVSVVRKRRGLEKPGNVISKSWLKFLRKCIPISEARRQSWQVRKVVDFRLSNANQPLIKFDGPLIELHAPLLSINLAFVWPNQAMLRLNRPGKSGHRPRQARRGRWK